MEHLSKAISFNADGATMMATGQYEHAAELFYAAMKEMESVGGRVKTPKTTNPAHHSWSFGVTQAFLKWRYDHRCMVFDKCFVVCDPEDGDVLYSTTKYDCELFIAGLIFNVALASHLQSRRDLDKKQECLQKALKQYELAANLLGSLEESHQGVALFLAVANNVTSLAIDLDNAQLFETYRGCMGEMLKEKVGFFHWFFKDNFEATKGIRRRPKPDSSSPPKQRTTPHRVDAV